MTLGLAQTLNSLSAQEEPIQFGSISIHLKATGAVAPSPMPVQMDRSLCGEKHLSSSLLLGPKGELQNAIVWLEGERVLGWPEQAAQESRTVIMERCEFSPRVIISPPKGRLVFKNLDPILHTIRAQGRKNYPIFRAHPPNLLETFFRFDQPEIVPVISDLHPWMRFYAAVAPHQNYATTDGKGKAFMAKVPYGLFKLKMWHEMLGSKELETDVSISRSSQEIFVTWAAGSP